MNDMAQKIQITINTLENLEIKSSFNNMNHLMGALKTLATIRDELIKKDEPKIELITEDEANE